MKILNLLHIILAITFASAFCSCEREDNQTSGNKVIFELNQSSPSSRATDTEFENGDAIGVYATVRSNPSVIAPLIPSGNYAENKKYIFDGTKFVPDGEANTIYTGHAMDYYLYYPYQRSITNPTNFIFSVSTDQTDGTTNSDLMLGRNNEGSTSHIIPITFTHAFSKVKVIYTPDEESKLQGIVIKNAFTNSSINLNGKLVTTSSGTRNDIKMYKDGIDSDYSFYAIIPAQAYEATDNMFSLSFSDNTVKNYKLTDKKEFVGGETTTIPFMAKELNYTFNILPISITADATATIHNYTYTSRKYYTINSNPISGSEVNLDYTVSSKDNWITVDKTTQKINVQENPQPSTRSGAILFTQAESGKTFTLPVSQNSATVRYELYISTSSGNIAASGGEKTIAGTLNTFYNSHITPDKEEPVTVTLSGSASGFTLASNKVIAGNNTTTDIRNIGIQGKYNDITSTNTITIAQDAGAKQFTSWSDWNISVSANPTTIAKTGGTSTITANAEHTRVWTWNGVAGSGGTESENASPSLSASGSGFNLSGNILSASNNTGTSARSCTVTATHSGKSANCVVTQEAGTITYGDWQVSVSANPGTIAASGGSSTLSYTATRDILTNGVKTGTETGTPTLSGSASGFTLSGSTVSAINNTSSSSRSITITATYSGKSSSCTVSQSAGSMTTDYSSWSTSSLSVNASPTTISASGGSSTLSATAYQVRDKYTKWNGITTNTTTESQNINVAGSASWSGSASGFSRNGTNVTAGNNTSTSSRSVTYTASYDGKSDYVTITQSGASISYGTWSVYINASPTSISSSGGTSTLTYSASRAVYTNGVQTDTEYATPSISGSASGFSRSGTTVTVSENSSTSSRSVTYTASYAGYSDYITITQAGASISENYIFELASGSTTNLVESASGSISYTVTSYKDVTINGSTSRTNVSYSTSANVSWISSGNSSSSYQENPDTSLRTGTITLTQSGSGKTITIQIRQKGKTSIDIN